MLFIGFLPYGQLFFIPISIILLNLIILDLFFVSLEKNGLSLNKGKNIFTIFLFLVFFAFISYKILVSNSFIVTSIGILLLQTGLIFFRLYTIPTLINKLKFKPFAFGFILTFFIMYSVFMFDIISGNEVKLSILDFIINFTLLIALVGSYVGLLLLRSKHKYIFSFYDFFLNYKFMIYFFSQLIVLSLINILDFVVSVIIVLYLIIVIIVALSQISRKQLSFVESLFYVFIWILPSGLGLLLDQILVSQNLSGISIPSRLSSSNLISSINQDDFKTLFLGINYYENNLSLTNGFFGFVTSLSSYSLFNLFINYFGIIALILVYVIFFSVISSFYYLDIPKSKFFWISIFFVFLYLFLDLFGVFNIVNVYVTILLLLYVFFKMGKKKKFNTEIKFRKNSYVFKLLVIFFFILWNLLIAPVYYLLIDSYILYRNPANFFTLNSVENVVFRNSGNLLYFSDYGLLLRQTHLDLKFSEVIRSLLQSNSFEEVKKYQNLFNEIYKEYIQTANESPLMNERLRVFLINYYYYGDVFSLETFEFNNNNDLFANGVLNDSVLEFRRLYLLGKYNYIQGEIEASFHYLSVSDSFIEHNTSTNLYLLEKILVQIKIEQLLSIMNSDKDEQNMGGTYEKNKNFIESTDLKYIFDYHNKSTW